MDETEIPSRRAAAIPNENDAGDPIQGLARVALHAWTQTARFTVGTYLRAGRRLAEAAVSPQSAVHLREDLERAIGGYIGELVRMADDDRVRRAVPGVGAVADAAAARFTGGGGARRRALPAAGEAPLRERGLALIEASNDVHYEEEAHPAYEWIIGELAPDEARILRLLARDGPQPAVDVRTGGPMSFFSSDLVAAGLNMIGPRAGCRYVERVHAYLNNLHRLGLIWFSRETLTDVHRYQVIEAQPEVLDAMHSVRIPKLVRRSIHLTPFGEDFCGEVLGITAGAEHHSPTGD
jgi:hypothetical protein